MKINNRENITPIKDACGELKELYNSENLSLAHAIIKEDAKPHKHRKMEEVYYITKGEAEVEVGGQTYIVKKGDVFSIPKDTYHHIKNVKETIEVIAITNPGFDRNDIIY